MLCCLGSWSHHHRHGADFWEDPLGDSLGYSSGYGAHAEGDGNLLSALKSRDLDVEQHGGFVRR